MSDGGNIPSTGRELIRNLQKRISMAERSLSTKANAEKVETLDKYVDQLLLGGGGGGTTAQFALTKSVTTFEADGTWTKPAGFVYALVRVQGGGGGGGGALLTGSGQASMGSGGGGGGYAESLVFDADMPSSVSVTVGAGGSVTSGGNGGDGGDSSFGSFATGAGGGAGTARPVSSVSYSGRRGGFGGSGTGDLVVGGDPGEAPYGDGQLGKSGKGGGSHLGGGGRGYVTTSGGQSYSGDSGDGAGGGGSGGIASATSGPRSGGAGSSGKVIVEAYTLSLTSATTIALTPVGVPYPTWEDPLPFGVIALEGQDLPRVGQYAPLFALWGTRFGVGDGSTTFGVPDMRGKGLMGYFSGDADFGTLGQEGGEREHTLTEAEMPSHDHGHNVRSLSDGRAIQLTGGSYAFDDSASSYRMAFDASTADADRFAALNAGDHTHSISSEGGDAPHNVLDPYVTARWVVRYEQYLEPPAGSLASVSPTPDYLVQRDGAGYAHAVGVRLTSTDDANATSTGHAIQVGDESGVNLIIDNNEIMVRDNGTPVPLYVEHGVSAAPGSYTPSAPGDLTTKQYVDTLNGAGYQLGSGVDMNTITEPGNYFQHNNANAASGTNYPLPVAGMLEVRAQDDGAFKYQRYTVYRSYESRTFVRNWYGGSWDDWREYADVTKRTLSTATFGSIASGFTFVDFSGYVRSGILSFNLRVKTNSAISVDSEGDLSNTTIWNLGSTVRPADHSHSLTSGRSGRVYSGCAYRDSGDLQITAAGGAGDTIEAGESITLGGTWVLD